MRPRHSAAVIASATTKQSSLQLKRDCGAYAHTPDAVGIDLRGANIAMPELLLHRADVRAARIIG